jgi:hypothetical protein
MAETDDSAHDDVAGYVLGTLDPVDADAFARHLAQCPACRAELADLEWLADLPVHPVVDEPLPAGLEARTFAAIDRSAHLFTEPKPEPDPKHEHEPARPARRRRSALRRWPVITAAAAVVAAAILTATLTLGSTSPSPGSRPIAIELASATGGPASGTAVIQRSTKGLSVDMKLEHLHPSPPGAAYTCWLVGPDDSPTHHDWVSLGDFTVGSSGSVTLHWMLTHDLYQHPRITVTRGADDNTVLATA